MKNAERVSLIRNLIISFLLALACMPWAVSADEPVESDGRTVYDQRQTGKYNIHVSIKDVAIIEMVENDIEDDTVNEGDYYYDESDLTVNPVLLTLTTPKPSTSTITSTAATTVKRTTSTPTPSSSSVEQKPTVLESNTAYNAEAIYSPNLIADAAATQGALEHSTLVPVRITANHSIDTKRYKTPSVVILSSNSNAAVGRPMDMSATTNKLGGKSGPTYLPLASSTTTHLPMMYDLKGRSKDVPTYAHSAPLLESRLRYENAVTEDSAYSSYLPHSSISAQPDQDSRIFKFKMRRGHKQAPLDGYFSSIVRGPARRCRMYQYRDANGNCRTKRSSSLLKKLFSMLVTLPLGKERAHDADE